MVMKQWYALYVSLYSYGLIKHDIAYITAMTEVEFKSEIESTKDTP